MGENDLTEESINLILRRADWRFLLSNLRPKKSIVFGGGILKDAVELVSESTVDSSLYYNDTDFELAAATDPDDKIIDEIFSVLKPGENCYIEWNVTPFCKLKSIETKLETAGFENITFYMPEPNPFHSPARIWIPLGVPSAINYSFNIDSSDNKFKVNLITKLRYFFWSLNPKLFSGFPVLFSSSLKGLLVASIACKPIPYFTNASFLNKTKLLDRTSHEQSHIV